MSDSELKNIIENLNNPEEKISEVIISNIVSLLKNIPDPNDKESYAEYKNVLMHFEENDIKEKVADIIPDDVFYQLGNKLLELKDKELTESYFEIFRTPNLLVKIYDDEKWPELILNLLKKIDYTFPKLFDHRCRKYSDKIIFTIMESDSQKDITWGILDQNVRLIRNGLYAYLGKNASNKKIVFLCENSIEMVYFDLACLTSGIVNIMIPANSTIDQIEYILNKTKPEIVIISHERQLDKLKLLRKNLSFLKWIVLFEQIDSWEDDYLSINQIKEKGKQFDEQIIIDNVNKIKLTDLASIMFTSGTTGNPKGIMFSHQNIVFKRFARAMAIPKIGESDIFISYLPLYHTFGRWLEMTGSIFWNARYVFIENPAIETVINNMQRIKPSIFISIPKKWYQLFERISQIVDLEYDEDQKILDALKNITGGNLKWGLSAAGHLDVEVFQFFQRNGVELMSGFGMTEATGGITMTPPGKYKPGSLGKALPGIKLKLAEDGELLIKGPYVMIKYINPEESGSSYENGWLATGDIMEIDDDGFIRIIDRKKEIYKNIKGETIAPQRIENFFGEFEFIKNVFLVGDKKHYNTILIYPNPESTQVEFNKMSDNEIHEYFSSIVVSVNKFLAPFERIVDFRIIDRAFDTKKGELTPKGTYKRGTIEKNFSHIINPMYEKDFTSILVGKIEIKIPNWFLREKGVTANDISFKNNLIEILDQKWKLFIAMSDDNIQIGDFEYQTKSNILDLGELIKNPLLWLGNEQLLNFAGEKIFKWSSNEDLFSNIKFIKLASQFSPDTNSRDQIQSLLFKKEYSYLGLHLSMLGITSNKFDQIKISLDYLSQAAKAKKTDYLTIISELLKRLLTVSNLNTQRMAFSLILDLIDDEQLYNVFKQFNDLDTYFINQEIISEIIRLNLNDQKLESLKELTTSYIESNDMRFVPLINLFSKYGASHPAKYKKLRQDLVQFQQCSANDKLVKTTRNARLEMRAGFREWLGKVFRIAVDIETGEEYTWDEVVIFEEDINSDHKKRILESIKNTTLIREAVFLFSRGIQIQLDDIPPGGVWVSFLGQEHGKTVYRVSIQTRFQGSFDFALNVNLEMNFDELIEEVEWLIRAGTVHEGKKLVEDFGGYWDEYDLWSEEFIHGETTGKFIKRMAKHKDSSYENRAKNLWPYFIWTGFAAYIDFWQRTNKRLEVADPSAENIIIPVHDYLSGSRIVSISERKQHISLLDMLINFYRNFVEKTEKIFDFLKGDNHWYYVFSAFPDTFGFEQGKAILVEFCEELKSQRPTKFYKLLRDQLNCYLTELIENGFIPKKLYFAIRRFNRWLELNSNATLQARISNLNELYNTYNLNQLEDLYPETRTLFYLKTVFCESDDLIKEKLKIIITKIRMGKISNENLAKELNKLLKQSNLGAEDQFYLTRLGYPYLKPEDTAEIIALDSGGEIMANLVVKYEDMEGNAFSVREPINPKEITRLHQLYLRNKLQVQFKPEHQFLIAVNERGYLIGGIFYKRIDDQVSHLEKIVVDSHYRKKGVSDILMNELFKRLKNNHLKFVTTGFFRPEYFYRFNFKIERKYAGLVKNLTEM